jgi:hypothetical protein
MEEHELTWPQVPTKSTWYSEPFDKYDVDYIPFNLLFDRDGRVIDIDVRGEELDRRLAALLGPPEARAVGSR